MSLSRGLLCQLTRISVVIIFQWIACTRARCRAFAFVEYFIRRWDRMFFDETRDDRLINREGWIDFCLLHENARFNGTRIGRWEITRVRVYNEVSIRRGTKRHEFWNVRGEIGETWVQGATLLTSRAAACSPIVSRKVFKRIQFMCPVQRV